MDDAELMADIGYLKALVEHCIPLAAVPDGETTKRIRRSAGISRQTAGVLLGCGANTLLRFEASQVRHSRFLKGSEQYRRFLAALMTYIVRTNPAEADAIRWNWQPVKPKADNDKEKVA